ncbi:MAG: hypothetical protein ACREXY_19490 [Gammaproteobacteria bacterium]
MFEVVAAVQVRKEIEGEWPLGLSGIASVVFGALLHRALEGALYHTLGAPPEPEFAHRFC